MEPTGTPSIKEVIISPTLSLTIHKWYHWFNVVGVILKDIWLGLASVS